MKFQIPKVLRVQRSKRRIPLPDKAGGPHESDKYVRLDEKRRVREILREEQVQTEQTPLFLFLHFRGKIRLEEFKLIAS